MSSYVDRMGLILDNALLRTSTYYHDRDDDAEEDRSQANEQLPTRWGQYGITLRSRTSTYYPDRDDDDKEDRSPAHGAEYCAIVTHSWVSIDMEIYLWMVEVQIRQQMAVYYTFAVY